MRCTFTFTAFSFSFAFALQVTELPIKLVKPFQHPEVIFGEQGIVFRLFGQVLVDEALSVLFYLVEECS